MKIERHVYFIKPRDSVGPIKIGSTNSVDGRLHIYKCWSPVPLELIVAVPGTFKHEHRLHDCFLDAHLHHEWFHPVPALLAGIEKLRAGVPLEEAFDLNAVVGNFRLYHCAKNGKRVGRPLPA